MLNRDKDLIDHILKHYEELSSVMAQHQNKQDFLNDVPGKKSVAFDLLQIGENLSKLSDDSKKKMDEKSFHGCIGLRNVIVHCYCSINYSLVWNIVHNDLPFLIDQIKKI